MVLPARLKEDRHRAPLARHTNFLWIVNGLIYTVLLFGTGKWRRLVPTSWDVFPHAWRSLRTYLSLSLPPVEDFQRHDALQQLTYAFIVFVVAPMMILTGIAMSPAVVGRFPWYARLFGNRRSARSLHFLGMTIYLVFLVFHVSLVFLAYPKHNVTHMVLGQHLPERSAVGLVIMLTMIAAVIAFWLWRSTGATRTCAARRSASTLEESRSAVSTRTGCSSRATSPGATSRAGSRECVPIRGMGSSGK